ncbi:MAG TPA: hypothetical protein VHE33_18560 [Acidobacteriaceae bacterium]|nr:hypothetical protein [Acidobacteriaceae bacterium]
MFRKLLVFALFFVVLLPNRAHAQQTESWQAKVAHELPLLGHRNWILVVDSAYPLQSAPGIETLETRAPQTLVLRVVLGEIENSEHVRPDIYTDAELPYVSDEDAPGISQFRANLADLLHAYPVQSQAHGKLIDRIDQDSQKFQVLVLKTNSVLPYSSVFINLKAKYWGDDAESRLRGKMGSGSQP